VLCAHFERALRGQPSTATQMPQMPQTPEDADTEGSTRDGVLLCRPFWLFNVAQIDPGTMKIVQTFDSKDRALIAGVSVAVQAGNAIYVGAFQGDRLVKIDWKQ